MKRVILTGALTLALAMPVLASAQTATRGAAGTSLGAVTLNKKVVAGGQPLAPGTYQVRLTGEHPTPGVGQSTEGEAYVEFVKAGKVVARELATVVSNADITAIVKQKKPTPNSVRVETLKGNDYVRVWINRSGNNYLINMPAGA
jgi:hypothetical protein